MNEKYLLKPLKPLKRKMHFQIGIRVLLYTLAAAGAIAFVVAVLSRFIVIPFVQIKLVYIVCCGTGSALLVSLFLSPGKRKVMQTADSLGLQERVITAWCLQEDTSPVAELQRQDTQNTLANIHFCKIYRVRVSKSLLILSVAFMLTAFVVSYIPGRITDDTRLRETLVSEMKKQEKTLEEKVKEQAEQHPEMTAEQLEKLQEAMERLEDAFEKAKTEEDALKALAQMENQMEKLQEGDPLKDLKNLENILTGSRLTKDMAEAMKSEDAELLKEALEKLMEEMEQAEAQTELAELFEEALQNIGEGSMLAESLKGLASAMASGSADAAEIAQSLSEMIQNASENAGSNQAFRQASNAVGEALGKARRSMASIDKQLAQGQGSQSGTQAEGQGAQSGEGGQGDRLGSGEGGSKGQGSGGGAGSGEGSTGEDAGYNEGDPFAGESGTMPGQRKEEAYRRIYVPERLGGEGNETTLSGQRLESGSSTFTEADGAPVQKGAMLPYKEVLSEYRQEAVHSMDRQEIPPGMKSLVRDYFSSLE